MKKANMLYMMRKVTLWMSIINSEERKIYEKEQKHGQQDSRFDSHAAAKQRCLFYAGNDLRQ